MSGSSGKGARAALMGAFVLWVAAAAGKDGPATASDRGLAIQAELPLMPRGARVHPAGRAEAEDPRTTGLRAQMKRSSERRESDHGEGTPG